MKIRAIAAACVAPVLVIAAEPAEDWAGHLKNIQIGESPDLQASFGGKLRLRGEYWDNFGFAEGNDDEFLLTRILLNSELKLGSHLRIFVEGISAHASDRDLPGGRRTLDADSLDLQQAYVDLKADIAGAAVTLRPGRQELLYGKQRLISPLDWSNTRRTFDGGKVMFRKGGWSVDGFAARLVQVDKYEFNDGDSGQDFYGVYATHKLSDRLSYDVYALGVDKDAATFGSATNAAADEERYTLGTRIWGVCPKSVVDFDVEGAWQFGDFADADISAWMIAAEVGYSFASSLRPRAHVGFDYASGDDDPDDGDLGTFNQLYPLGHAFFGYADFVGRQNILDFSAGFSIKPCSAATVRLDGHYFERAEDSDALYNAGGAVVRGGGAGDSSEVGSELDLTVKAELDRHTAVLLGYSRFFAGDFIDESGASADIDFAYASVEYSF